MDEFMKKWHEDKKYRAKIKLCLYGVFIILVTIYAAGLSRNIPSEKKNDNDRIHSNMIIIPETYHYNIDINIDNNMYTYYGDKQTDKMTINKLIDDTLNVYIYQNDTYYHEENGEYVVTTKDEVYDVANYSYINLESINNYLSKATYTNNEYHIYLKDVILNSESNEYFTITMNDNMITIDYTPLAKEFNHDITNYKVNILLEDIHN